MKQWRILLATILGLLLLVACGGTETVEPAVAEPVSGEDTEFVAQLDPNRPYSQNDLTLVGASGKPQFLNSYADW